jgi:molybdopterin-guanine dinucleotide biosynthesis protein A
VSGAPVPGAAGPYGAILAGGASRRYGSPKALAEVGGVRIVDRVVAALRQVAPELIVSANDPELFADLGLPTHADVRPGLGALGGIQSVLLQARIAQRPGVLAVACDMPFPSVPLLRRLRELAFSDTVDPPPDVVVPESTGRRGIEPLFAAYRVGCIPAIENRIEAGDHRMISFHDDVRVHRVPLSEVEALCDPSRAFLNVNTPDERDRAERLAERGDDTMDHATGGVG